MLPVASDDRQFSVLEPGLGFVVIFILGMVGPVLQFSGMQIGILGLFIPILGRVGASFNPDIIVGLYCSHTFAMLFSYSVSPKISFVFSCFLSFHTCPVTSAKIRLKLYC